MKKDISYITLYSLFLSLFAHKTKVYSKYWNIIKTEFQSRE